LLRAESFKGSEELGSLFFRNAEARIGNRNSDPVFPALARHRDRPAESVVLNRVGNEID
jgi:hypothetical protein